MKYILLLILVTLPACGFTPLYGPSSIANEPGIAATLNQVQINNIPDRTGQSLRNALIDRFYTGGTPANPIYKLTIAPLNESRSDLDVTVNDEATRRQLRMSTTIALARMDDTGPAIFTRSIYTIVSYNVLQSQFTTRVAEQNARDNAIADLARQIEQSIVIGLRDPQP